MIRSLTGHAPLLGPESFVHEAAEVIGRVRIGRSSSIWPCAVVRGDSEDIAIGDETNVQDGAIVHADPGLPCTIGSRITVGHRACVHGCTVEDECLIGIGATLLNGSRIGEGSIVGAGALVPEGVEIPARSLVLGLPARVIRETTPEERAGLRASAARYVEMIDVHRP